MTSFQVISPVDGRIVAERPRATVAEELSWQMGRPLCFAPGEKDSGRGCTLSRIGFESLTRPESFHLRTDTTS